MTRLAALFLLLWTCVLSAQELPVLPAPDHAAWQAIGRVNAAGYRTREMCTGTLIAPDKVLTAAHCVAGTDGFGPRPEDFTFVAGWLRGTAADSVTGASVWVHPGLRFRHDHHRDSARGGLSALKRQHVRSLLLYAV